VSTEPKDLACARDPAQSGVETVKSLRNGDADRDGEVDELVQSVRAAQEARYHTGDTLAAGGMGTIHEVRDRSLTRSLALKVHHEHLAHDHEHVEMFVREARLTGQLDHPNVVPVHDLGVRDDGRLFFTMKLVEGRTLLDWVKSLRGFPSRDELLDLIDVVVKVCDALAFAHSKGVVHCDVKPANVMVGEFGQVYLMDWGIARLVAEELARPPDVEDPDRVVGTPTHMPPEQARGLPVDERADIFAVGALMYHVLTRRPPYRGDSHIQVLAQAFLCRQRHPDEILGEGVCPPTLTSIVLRAMQPERDDRWASISDLRDALVRFARGGESFEAVQHGPGEVIVREGDQGDAAFIIESGACEVLKGGTRIRVMGPGEVFGEMAILSPGARTATVKTLEESVLRRVSAAILRAELDSMKPWMGALVRTLADRFREREEEG